MISQERTEKGTKIIKRGPKGTNRNQKEPKGTKWNPKEPKRNQNEPDRTKSYQLLFLTLMLLNSTGVYTQKLSLKLRSRNSSTTIGNVVVVGSAGKKQQIGVVNKQHFF